MIPVKRFAIPNSERKRLGAFYTPESLSRILTDWAVRTPNDRVLEPSFGRCGFLAAARRRLEELGCKVPKSQIFGCDVDSGAFHFLVEVLGLPIDTEKFRQDDFLELQPEIHWPHLFEATVGNPPYIPYQAIPEQRRYELARRGVEKSVPVGGRASLWAYFLIHAVSFVAPGGRMAWVLPGAFLQADYAVAVRQFLGRAFEEVFCVLMHQRFFKQEGTEEETVVLLAKGRHDPRARCSPCEISFADASTIDELSKLIERWEGKQWSGRILDARPSYLATENAVIRMFESVRFQSDCHILGLFLKANIGLVTGANAFFVLSEENRQRLSLDKKDTVPVLSKFHAARGLSFTTDDHSAYLEAGGCGHLVQAKTLPPEGTPLRQYLDTFTEEERAKVKTFKKRSIWHAPDDAKIPDAFLSVMNHNGPRLVLNEARMNCTNTIHRVFFVKPLDDTTKKLLVISLLTSFSQLSAEFVGRRYGSGVLKHEPREAEKISVLLPRTIEAEIVDTAFKEIDDLLRAGNSQEARVYADRLVLHNLLDGEILSSTFNSALSTIRELRRSTRYISGV